MKKFLYLILATGLTFSHAHAAYADTINALSIFDNQLIALKNALAQTEEENYLESVTKAHHEKLTKTQKEVSRALFAVSDFPAEIAEIAISYEPREFALTEKLEGREPVNYLLPLPGGNLAIARSTNIRLWNAKTKNLSPFKTDFENEVSVANPTALAFIPPHTLICTNASSTHGGQPGPSHSLTFWNIETQKFVETRGGNVNYGERITAFIAHQNNLIVILEEPKKYTGLFGKFCGPAYQIKILDERGIPSLVSKDLSDKSIHSLAALPNGDLVIGAENRLLILDPVTLDEKQRLSAKTETLAVLPNGSIVSAIASTLSVWEKHGEQFSSKPQLLNLQPEAKITALATLLDGKIAVGYTIPNKGNNIAVWVYEPILREWTLEFTLENCHNGKITALAVLSDGRLVSGDAVGVIKIWR